MNIYRIGSWMHIEVDDDEYTLKMSVIVKSTIDAIIMNYICNNDKQQSYCKESCEKNII